MRILACLAVLTWAASAFAEPATVIRMTGEHIVASGDTLDLARQSALLDAEQKTVVEAAARLQRWPGVKTLHLTADELEAYVAGILDIEEEAPRTAALTRRVYAMRVHARLNPADMLRRIAQLEKDQDAATAVVELRNETNELRRHLAEDRRPSSPSPRHDVTPIDRLQGLTTLRVKLIVGRATVALAKTEERAVGGRAASDAGQARARRLAETALALSPDSADAHACMGDVLFHAREFGAALEEYRAAVRRDANLASSHIKLASALMLQQNLAEAADELREALRLAPRSARAHTDMAWVLRGQQSLSAAVAEYQEALRLDPDFVDAHNGLAVSLASQGHLPEAIAEFREMVRVDPDSAVGYYNLAYALADLDEDAASAAALREVVRINPNHYNAHYNLGDLFRIEGKFDESAKQFREYLRLAPDAPQNQRNIERAKRLADLYERNESTGPMSVEAHDTPIQE